MDRLNIRLAMELMGVARMLQAFRDKEHQPERREQNRLRDIIRDEIDDYYDEFREDNEDGRDESQFYRIRSVYDQYESEVIQEQYERAMSRKSSYIGNVYGWTQGGPAQVIESEDGDYVVGFRCKSAFILSHFAPRTLRSGARFLQYLCDFSTPIIAAIPQDRADMLARLGYKEIGHIPQYFDGEIVDKTVMASATTTDDVVSEVLESQCGISYGLIAISDEDLYSAEDVAKCIVDNSIDIDSLEDAATNRKYSSFIRRERILDIISALATFASRDRWLLEQLSGIMDKMEKSCVSNRRFKLLRSRVKGLLTREGRNGW